MKTEIYQWVKNLSVFYILFSMILHLIPDPKYERYIKLFMGLLLIYILCTPVLAFMGKSEELIESFSVHYQEELEKMNTDEAENLQRLYLNRGYCRELEQKILERFMKAGLDIQDVAVCIADDQISAEIHVTESLTSELERRIKDELAGEFGIGEKNICIISEGDEPTAMGSSAAVGSAADGDLDTDIREEQRK